MRLEFDDEGEILGLLHALIAAKHRAERAGEAEGLRWADRAIERIGRHGFADRGVARAVARCFEAPSDEVALSMAGPLAGRLARGLLGEADLAAEARRACLPHAATEAQVNRIVEAARARAGFGEPLSDPGDEAGSSREGPADPPSGPEESDPLGDPPTPDDATLPASGGRAASPGLTLVSVPIGDARDVTLRALDVLASAEVLAAEDTRSLRRLMAIHGVALGGRPLVAYHDHNGPRARPRLLRALAEGRSVAYASEAGTPLVADPGYALARAAIEAGHPVTAAPGASAVLAALAVGGLPSDRFLFAGFPPPAAGARRRWLEGLDAAGATVALYESPRRIHRLLGEMAEVFGADRPAALCRELTKRFEEALRGTLGDLSEAVEGRALKGEVVVLLGRAQTPATDGAALRDALRAALSRASLRDAVAEVSRETGLPRRQVYAAALAMEGGDGREGDADDGR